MSYLVKSGDKLFVRKTAGPWDGLMAAEIKEEKPVHHWTGPKCTLEHWRQVLAFFEWSNCEHKSEALVQWFVDLESGRWQPIAPPQEGVGMTVKVLTDHPNYKTAYERLGPGNWELMRTDHHHCSGSAFQSGTDHKDEITKEGLHVTVGGIGGGKYSLHSRCSFRNIVTDAELGEWFEVPESYRDLPIDIQGIILEHVLTTPASGQVPGTHFPEWWADNYIKRQFMTQYGHNWKPLNSREWKPHISLANDISDFCGSRGMSREQFLEWVKELANVDGIAELVDICASNYSDLADVIVAAHKEDTVIQGFEAWDDGAAWARGR